MKKLNLVLALEGVLLVAVIVLFVLFFTKKSPEGRALISGGSDTTAFVASGDMAFVNLDTLMVNYQMSKDLNNELLEKSKKIDAELTNKGKKLQQDYSDLQYKAQRGLETNAKLEEMGQQLRLDDQKLMQLTENYRMQLAEEQVVMNRKVVQAIMDFLTEYNRDKGYQYVFGDSFDGKILYANPGLDITNPVLDGLNVKYKAANPAKK